MPKCWLGTLDGTSNMVQRGEIYWLELPEGTGSQQSGRRPVLIIQNDVGNQYSTTTIVAAITSQPRRRAYPFHVAFTAEEGLLRLDGTVLCEQIQTVDQASLESIAGGLPDSKMAEVDEALHLSLGLRT